MPTSVFVTFVDNGLATGVIKNINTSNIRKKLKKGIHNAQTIIHKGILSPHSESIS